MTIANANATPIRWEIDQLKVSSGHKLLGAPFNFGWAFFQPLVKQNTVGSTNRGWGLSEAASHGWHASNAGQKLGDIGQLGHGQHWRTVGRCDPYSPTLQTIVISDACHLRMKPP